MALYTGVRAVKKIKGIDNSILLSIPWYSEMKGYIDYFEDCGGYPPIAELLHILNISEEMEDTDENYYNIYPDYLKKIQEYELSVSVIESQNLKNKIQEREIMFVTRKYALAEDFQALFNSSTFYFRKEVELDKLLLILPEVLSYDMSDIIMRAKELGNNWIFEVHVS